MLKEQPTVITFYELPKLGFFSYETTFFSEDFQFIQLDYMDAVR